MITQLFDDNGSGLGGELCVLSLFCDNILEKKKMKIIKIKI